MPFTYTAEFYDVYQKLAKQYYTQMPKGRLQSFYQIAKQAGDLKSTWSKAEFVKKYLRNNASYSMNLDPVPKGADYAEYFLLVQKKAIVNILQQPERFFCGLVVCRQDM